MSDVIVFAGELLLHFCSSSSSEGASDWKLSGLLSPSVNARRRHFLYFQSAVNFPSWTSRTLTGKTGSAFVWCPSEGSTIVVRTRT